MSVRLLDETQAHDEFARRLESREWWIVPVIGSAASDAMCAIEAAHYAGEANADFELLLGPLPPFGQMATAFAHKRRMSADQLGVVLAEFGAPDFSAALRAGHDVLVIAEED